MEWFESVDKDVGVISGRNLNVLSEKCFEAKKKKQS